MARFYYIVNCYTLFQNQNEVNWQFNLIVPFTPFEYSSQLFTTKVWSSLFDDEPIAAKQSHAAWKCVQQEEFQGEQQTMPP